MKERVSLILSSAAVAVAAFVGATTAAAATATCPTQTSRTAFASSGDRNSYFLVPGGSFESAPATGWTLAGGVARVAGNETFFANASTDAWSLGLPAGGSAVTPAVCIDQTTPTLRFFARNTGAVKGTLSVDVLYTNTSGKNVSATVQISTGTATWAVSPEISFLNKIKDIKTGPQNVQFRFTAAGAGAQFQIDDIFVDPRKSF